MKNIKKIVSIVLVLTSTSAIAELNEEILSCEGQVTLEEANEYLDFVHESLEGFESDWGEVSWGMQKLRIRELRKQIREEIYRNQNLEVTN